MRINLITLAVLSALAAGSAGGAQAQLVVEETIADVDWAAAAEDAGDEGAAAVPQQSQTLRAAASGGESIDLRLPLLLPTSLVELGRAGEMDRPLTLYADENFYTAQAEDEGRFFLIQGSIVVFASEGAPALEEAASEIVVTETETGVEATFSRYNVAYSILIECEDLFDDPACAGPEFVTQLAEEMAFAP